MDHQQLAGGARHRERDQTSGMARVRAKPCGRRPLADTSCLADNDEYLVERDFGRVIGRPLALSPMDVEHDDHATGLVRLLLIRLAPGSRTKIVSRARSRSCLA